MSLRWLDCTALLGIADYKLSLTLAVNTLKNSYTVTILNISSKYTMHLEFVANRKTIEIFERACGIKIQILINELQ